MIALTLAAALACMPTPDPTDGCAGYCFTLPSDCYVRELRDFVSDRPTFGRCVCQPIGTSGYFACRCYVGPYPISCACFDERDPPPGQVWMRAE